MLDAKTPAQARVVRVGDIARGEDVRVGRAEVLVDDDPVADLEPSVRRELGMGVIPTPTRTKSAAIRLPSLRLTPVTAPFLPASSTTET